MPVLSLSYSAAEVAHHEAGHAVAEVSYAVTPKLLVMREEAGVFTGDIFTTASVDRRTAPMRADKAVAGVLAQALYVARQTAPTAQITTFLEAVEAMTAFFLQHPTADRECEVRFEGASELIVNLRSCYSVADYTQFRIAVSELASGDGPPNKFFGNEPECVPFARASVERTVQFLNDPDIWRAVSQLAKALQEAPLLPTRTLKDNDIDRETVFAFNYHVRNQRTPPS